MAGPAHEIELLRLGRHLAEFLAELDGNGLVALTVDEQLGDGDLAYLVDTAELTRRRQMQRQGREQGLGCIPYVRETGLDDETGHRATQGTVDGDRPTQGVAKEEDLSWVPIQDLDQMPMRGTNVLE